MRILEFTQVDKEKYDLIYEGFVYTSKPIMGPDIRLCAKVFDKLETLGKYSDNPQDKEKGIYVFDHAGQIFLEEPEFRFLIDCMNQTKYNAMGARRVVKVMNWLNDIKEEPLLKLE